MQELTQNQTKLYIHPLYCDYSCDEEGNVYSKQRSSRNITSEFKKLKPADNGSGYLIFTICNEGKYINKRVHHFVFECYKGKTYQYSSKSGEGLTINHIDGNKLNNLFDNLEIKSHRENVQLREDFKHENKSSGLPRFVALNKNYLEKGYINPYYVKIHFEGKQRHFGSFPTPELAQQVAESKFKELYPSEEY